MSDRNEIIGFAALVVMGLIVAVIIWVVASSFEAEAYNRLTNGHATTWDAMWTELRVATPEPQHE